MFWLGIDCYALSGGVATVPILFSGNSPGDGERALITSVIAGSSTFGALFFASPFISAWKVYRGYSLGTLKILNMKR